MSHYDKVIEILDLAAQGYNYAEIGRKLNIAPKTITNYLIRSRQGDEAFASVIWHDVAAPFHHHLLVNARALIGQNIIQSAHERALHGVETDVFFQGQRQYERVIDTEKYPDWKPVDEFGLPNDEPGDLYITKPVKQWLKPSDALVLRMMEAYDKRFQPGQSMTVNYSGKLTLRRPEENAKPVIDATAASFEEVAEGERPALLALQRHATSSEEFDKWTQQGDFDPAPVDVVAADGTTHTLQADPLQPKPTDSPLVADLKARAAQKPVNPVPLDAAGRRTIASVKSWTQDDERNDDGTKYEKPTPTPPPYAKETRRDARPISSPGDGRERLGYGGPDVETGWSTTAGRPRGFYK